MKNKLLTFLAVGLLAAPMVAQAVVIHDSNATPNFTILGNTIVNRAGAANFTLASAAQLTDVHFWTMELTTLEDWWGEGKDLEWYLWQGASPGGAPLSSGDATNISRATTACGTGAQSGYNCVSWSFDLTSAVELAADTSYWLGLYIRNWGGSGAPGVYWARYSGGAGDDCTSSTGTNLNVANATWACNFKGDFAFNLTGTYQTVPEPTTLWLLGLSLVGLGFARRRTK